LKLPNVKGAIAKFCLSIVKIRIFFEKHAFFQIFSIKENPDSLFLKAIRVGILFLEKFFVARAYSVMLSSIVCEDTHNGGRKDSCFCRDNAPRCPKFD
jgi:hypothetical protein